MFTFAMLIRCDQLARKRWKRVRMKTFSVSLSHLNLRVESVNEHPESLTSFRNLSQSGH